MVVPRGDRSPVPDGGPERSPWDAVVWLDTHMIAGDYALSHCFSPRSGAPDRPPLRHAEDRSMTNAKNLHATRELTVVLEGYSYLECPRWHEGRLWVSDFYTNQVVATDGKGGTEVVANVPSQPSGLGFLPDGRALIVSMRDHRVLVRDASGALSEHADLTGVVTGMPNDMVVDQRGRAYVGNFGFDLMGGAPLRYTTLTRVDPDGSVTTVADDLGFPNGMVILPGGDVLVVAETFAG